MPTDKAITPANATDVKNSLGGRLKEFLNDVVTLDVLTLSGDLTLDPAGAANFKLEDVLARVLAQAKATDASRLSVVAYTHAEWDHDSINFVKANPNDADKLLIESHRAAVEAAHRNRSEMIRTIGDLIKVL